MSGIGPQGYSGGQGTAGLRATTEGSVVLFNVATHQFVANLASPGTANLIGVAFSPDGNTLATTHTTGDAFIWSMKWLYG